LEAVEKNDAQHYALIQVTGKAKTLRLCQTRRQKRAGMTGFCQQPMPGNGFDPLN
jgi:hypothetical protein